LKSEVLFENYLSSKIALAAPNKKNMCVKEFLSFTFDNETNRKGVEVKFK
jgi:hypothetical protein